LSLGTSLLLLLLLPPILLLLLLLQAGQREVLVGSLPGLPAGLSKASDGNYWVSMTVPVPPYSK
jgi:hypothetical protein